MMWMAGMQKDSHTTTGRYKQRCPQKRSEKRDIRFISKPRRKRTLMRI